MRTTLGGGWLVGCSQNSLTTRFAASFAKYPQVKRGSTHSRSEALFGVPRLWSCWSSASTRDHGQHGYPGDTRNKHEPREAEGLRDGAASDGPEQVPDDADLRPDDRRRHDPLRRNRLQEETRRPGVPQAHADPSKDERRDPRRWHPRGACHTEPEGYECRPPHDRDDGREPSRGAYAATTLEIPTWKATS